MSNELVDYTVLGSKGQRIADFIIDIVIINVINYAISAILIGIIISSNTTDPSAITSMTMLSYLISIAMLIAYYTLSETFMKGKTIGKYVSKTTAYRVDGSPITMKDAFIRSICRLIPFEAFSFLGENTYGWHDSISKTMVVDDEKFKNFSTNNLENIGASNDNM